MAKMKKFDLESPAPVVDDEDEETLAAIDQGLRDAEAGRTVPAEEVRRLLPKWTTDSSTQKALDDLAEIVGYIAEDNAEAAARFGSSLIEHVELLARFPRMGGLIRQRAQIRKLAHSPFLVYYRIRESKREIEILHIRHGARKPPKSELRRNQ
jgi:plasmid stabilization system protein ParE